MSFWCVDPLVLILEINWFCYPDVFQHYACGGGALSLLDFHVMLKTLLIETRALYRVLCSGVSISLFDLCIKLTETVLQLVVLVAIVIVGPGCVRLVRSIILVIKFSCAWRILSIPIGCLGLFHVICTIRCTGC